MALQFTKKMHFFTKHFPRKIKWPILIPFGACVVFMLSLFLTSAYWLQERHLRHDVNDKIYSVEQFLQKHLAENSLEIIQSLDDFVKDYNIAQLWLQQDKETLGYHTRSFFARLWNQKKFSRFSFIDKEKKCFLLAHSSKSYDTSSTSAVLDQVARTGQATYGLELSPLGTFCLKVIIPCFQENSLVGYLEVTKEFAEIIPELKQIFNLDFFILINKKHINPDNWPKIETDKDLQQLIRPEPWNFIPGYVTAGRTMEVFPEDLHEFFSHGSDENIFHQDGIENINVGTGQYRGNFINLKDFTDQEVGVLAVLAQTTALDASLKNLFFIIGFFCLGLGTVLFLVFYLFMDKVEQKLLSTHKELEEEIHERALAEKEIFEQKEFLNTTLNSLTHPFYVINAANFEVIMANKAAGFGDFCKGAKCHELTHDSPVPCNTAHHPCSVAEIKHTGKPVTLEHIHKSAAGSKRHMEINAYPVFDGKGKITAIIEYCFDITKRKRDEETLKRAKTEAEAASRAKSEFMANMSHEIRTPMNGILGFSELLLNRVVDETDRNYLNLVKDSANKLMDIINDILDFSKIEAGKFKLDLVPFDLNDVLSEAMKMMAIRAHEKKLELAYFINPDVPQNLIGDPGRIRQIIINLVANAVKFTKEGEIVVRVEPAKPGDGAKSLCEGGIQLHFSVQDTGIGISPAQQDHIFEAFTQADGTMTREYGGTGLGLTICSQLVTLMHGDIWLESIQGRGSTFHFTACLKKQAAENKKRELMPLEDLKKLSVLVVDDNESNLIILENILTEKVKNLTLARSGNEALDALAEQKLDLAILDVQMPEIDGFMIAEKIRRHKKHRQMNIIILTSAGLRGDASRCQELGIAAYLMKPVGQTELLQAIRTATSQSLQETASVGQTELITRHSLREMNSKINLLLVEDDMVNRTFASALLSKAGFKVQTAVDGVQALDLLERDHYDLVLMDLQMPKMDGFEVTRKMREKERSSGEHLPIIAMTAHAMEGDRKKCLQAGMDDYISKPVKPEILFDTIEQHISEGS